MSWATYKAEITGALTGYTELPQNSTPEEATKGQTHKYFSLKAFGSENFDYTSSVQIGSYLVELQIIYAGLNNSDTTSNFDLFDGVCDSVKTLSNFKGWTDNPSFEEIDKKHSKGVCRFYYGIRVL